MTLAPTNFVVAPDEVTVIEAEVESWLEPVLDVSLAAGEILMTHVEAQSTMSADHGTSGAQNYAQWPGGETGRKIPMKEHQDNIISELERFGGELWRRSNTDRKKRNDLVVKQGRRS